MLERDDVKINAIKNQPLVLDYGENTEILQKNFIL
jgi:hypothetical protein